MKVKMRLLRGNVVLSQQNISIDIINSHKTHRKKSKSEIKKQVAPNYQMLYFEMGFTDDFLMKELPTQLMKK